RGIPFARLFAPETLAGLKREFSGFPFGRVVKVEDAVCLRSDASEVHVWLSISPVQDHSGKHLGAAAIARDISELQHMNESLQHLSGELLRSQDEERRRIARELHDSTAQGLAGVAMNLAVLERSKAVAAEPRASKLVGEALSLARQCAKEVRALSYLLHPPLLDELGLASALRSYAEGFTERTGIQLRLELPQDFGRFPPEVETTLFRIVQECLANVHRHSGSPQAVIRIRRGPGQVALEVEDEGHGLLQGALSTGGRGSVRLGVGIPGMRERARQLGGKLEIVSGRQGTRVRVILPLQPSGA
ncbi:MAG TPA: histidine kinase, partial [Bryobacteraceae bacterium]|nr:histidine kinase [Bryobacteraceae bacterium]